MEYYTNDTIIARMTAGYNTGGHYEQSCNNKTINPVQLKFTCLDALLIKLLELRR